MIGNMFYAIHKLWVVGAVLVMAAGPAVAGLSDTQWSDLMLFMAGELGVSGSVLQEGLLQRAKEAAFKGIQQNWPQMSDSERTATADNAAQCWNGLATCLQKAHSDDHGTAARPNPAHSRPGQQSQFRIQGMSPDLRSSSAQDSSESNGTPGDSKECAADLIHFDEGGEGSPPLEIFEQRETAFQGASPPSYADSLLRDTGDDTKDTGAKSLSLEQQGELVQCIDKQCIPHFGSHFKKRLQDLESSCEQEKEIVFRGACRGFLSPVVTPLGKDVRDKLADTAELVNDGVTFQMPGSWRMKITMDKLGTLEK